MLNCTWMALRTSAAFTKGQFPSNQTIAPRQARLAALASISVVDTMTACPSLGRSEGSPMRVTWRDIWHVAGGVDGCSGGRCTTIVCGGEAGATMKMATKGWCCPERGIRSAEVEVSEWISTANFAVSLKGAVMAESSLVSWVYFILYRQATTRGLQRNF